MIYGFPSLCESLEGVFIRRGGAAVDLGSRSCTHQLVDMMPARELQQLPAEGVLEQLHNASPHTRVHRGGVVHQADDSGLVDLVVVEDL